MKIDITEKLSMLGQTQLLRYKNELSPEQFDHLAEQIADLDFSVLTDDVYEQERGAFAPIPAVSKEKIKEKHEYYTQLGIDAIQSGKVGAVLLAGGQGSRLGFDKPKGMFNIGINRELFIFECLIINGTVFFCKYWRSDQ